ncbi:GntR family transcriptional regulator [Plastoroseomonas hellenica]|uniref:GntR family transcriptional regulator n=1 Tax=Plastoroseomonas hellenica TaxID=2687306 RepID=UPI001BA68299|nr:GntR family transcriptional regulator [Plastoroseomonas hellenica]MBR0643629.1 GntR family transcriptional regulator [Plastoroseomonas hellenica]
MTSRSRDLPGAQPRMHARTADLLAARIADGSLPPGTALFESRLAALLGTSRGPTRQALARLEAQGLVRRAEGRGYVVAGAARRPGAALLVGLDGLRLAPSASWERVYAEVERAIVARMAFATWRVVETDLARHHGVSRTVAREVIARLHQRGLLRRDDRARWYAPALTAAHVGELYEVRALLEPAALTAAAPRLPAGFASGLRTRVAAAMMRAEILDGAELDELEADLHVRLLGHCPNATLMEAVRLHQSLLVAHSFLYAWVPRLFPAEPFLPEHLAVLTPLEAGKVAESAEALRRHLRDSLARAVARIEQVKRAPQPPALPYLRSVP